MKYVQPSRDYEFLNRVVNDPEVFPLLALEDCGDAYIDTRPLFDNENNLFFANDFGGFMLTECGDGVYEVHSQFLASGRDRRVVFGAVEVMAHMFTTTNCEEIVTACPFGNARAIRLTEAVGMTKTGEKKILGTPCHMYSITKESWKCRYQQ